MADERDVTLWPTPENYARFAELCDDEVPANFEEFESAAIVLLDCHAQQGLVVDKVAFDPDKMARWCRAHYGKVDSIARAHYAAFLATAS